MTTAPSGDPHPAPRPRPALVVTGMHRSGTSAMARILSLAGGALPERVIQPGPDNPLGFWEPSEMVALSDEILAEVGSAWDDVFVHQAGPRAWDRPGSCIDRAEAMIMQNYADRDLPVIKDPRSSVLARLWHQALVNCGRAPLYIIMVRHPLEVASSLNARDGFPISQGMLLWAAYMLSVERDTRSCPRVFVPYAGMLENPSGTLDRIEAAFGISLPRRDLAETEIGAFLSQTHRHHRAEALPPAGREEGVVDRVHDWTRAAAAGSEPDPGAMDAAGQAMEELARTWGPILDHQKQQGTARLTRANIALADSEARLLRERARVGEVIAAEESRRIVLERAVHDATLRMDAAMAEAVEQEAMLRDLRFENTRLKSTVSDLLGDQDALNKLRHQLAEDVGTLQRRNAAIKSSLSWKITRPVRAIQSRLKKTLMSPAALPGSGK
ncbi:sulfotransferase family protein [Brevundimonas sp. R86498]|uniref:sulfotransferase family protein n=1 Tax=Brevundimonas sp. R86498 TaxID=3093845 RepID=UPI0037C9E3A6